MVREFRKVKGCCYYLLSSVSAFKYVSVVLSQFVTNHPLCHRYDSSPCGSGKQLPIYSASIPPAPYPLDLINKHRSRITTTLFTFLFQ